MLDILTKISLEKKIIIFSVIVLIMVVSFTLLSYTNKLKIYDISSWITHSNEVKDRLSNLAAEINREAIDLHDY